MIMHLWRFVTVRYLSNKVLQKSLTSTIVSRSINLIYTIVNEMNTHRMLRFIKIIQKSIFQYNICYCLNMIM
jgi:hypothetical protein